MHNERRARHEDTNPLEFNLDLACQATSYAIYLDQTGSFADSTRSDRPGQGENLSMHTNRGVPGSPTGHYADQPEGGWYEGEIDDYNFAAGRSNGGVTGHFTQMVWRDTTELGCGFSNLDDEDYIVCRYSPAGNSGWPEDFVKQVGVLI